MEETFFNPGTFFAPAGRSDDSALRENYRKLASDIQLEMIAEAIPDVALILDQNRQAVFANHALLNLIGSAGGEDILGHRPGEILNCINVKGAPDGCGTSKACRLCGAVNAILECQTSGTSSTRECRIVSRGNGESQQSYFDFEVKASPFYFKGLQFTMFVVKDISDKKRRQMLEQMFFHDILNTALGLNGLLEAIENPESEEEFKMAVSWARKAGNEILEELVSQRTLVAAENGNLVVEPERCSPVQLLNDAVAYLSYQKIAGNKKIFIDPFSHATPFESDPALIRRVLINLMKNALEASPVGSVIKAGVKFIDKYVRFWVNNPGEMPEDVRMQIFQRSFSTKGENRGIGTYSIKLIVTEYLKGKVTFESNSENGTTFRVDLPVSLAVGKNEPAAYAGAGMDI